MDAKGEGKLPLMGEISNSNEMLPIVAIDHEVPVAQDPVVAHVADLVELDIAGLVVQAQVPVAQVEVENGGLALALAQDPVVAHVVELDIAGLVVQAQVPVAVAQVEVENGGLALAQDHVVAHVADFQVDLDNPPQVGAHNIRNLRGRPKRRPFSKPLSPKSQARFNEAKAKSDAMKKAQKEKDARLNAPNRAGLKKAQKPAFSKV